jgi:hypothetical protein
VIDDWRPEIVKGVVIQQRIEELDQGRLWQRHLPEVAASDDELQATEEQLGHGLDPRYRAFLRVANGWRSFYQAVDLFATRNLLGAPPMDSAIAQLNSIEPRDLESAIGMTLRDVLPIGASAAQRDIFLLARPWSADPGVVVWFASREVQRFPNFDEFYLSMLDYNRQEVAYLENETQ